MNDVADQWISEDSIRSSLHKLSSERGLSSKQADAIQEEIGRVIFSTTKRIHPTTGKAYFRLEEVTTFFDNWLRSFVFNDPAYLFQTRGLRRDIVSIEEFVCSPEFMNQEKSIRYPILQCLNKAFSSPQYIEIVLGGAIGIGKNYMAEMAFAYILYQISCYENPQVELGLAPGSGIYFTMQSVTHSLAKKVIFASFKSRIADSPYFTKEFPFDKSFTNELKFPNGIWVVPISGSDTSALGLNIFTAIIDEINFLVKSKASKFARLRGEDEYDKANELYRQILRRMKSRFMQAGGGIPGKLFLVSSANYPGDFVDEKREESKHDPTILYLGMAQWEAFRLKSGILDPRRYSGKLFTIDVGDERTTPRILKEGELVGDPSRLLSVPVEHKSEFEKDIDAALRDIAGVPRARRHRFFQQRESIVYAERMFTQLAGGQQLFVDNKVNLEDYQDPDLPELIDRDYIKRMIKGWKDIGFTRPPEFAVHLDAGLTSDSFGIAIARVMGLSSRYQLKTYVLKTDDYKEVRGAKAPIIFVDGLLQVVPPRVGEISLEMIQALLFTAMNMGVPIRYVSMDSFASKQILQTMGKHRDIVTKMISVDKTIEPYMTLKLGVIQRRIVFPEHATLRRELDELELDRKLGKVNHPDNGSKDIADALCGVVFRLTRMRATYAAAGAEIELPDLPEDALSKQESAVLHTGGDLTKSEETDWMALSPLFRKRVEQRQLAQQGEQTGSTRRGRPRPKSGRVTRFRHRRV
jgi:hypothetical protein